MNKILKFLRSRFFLCAIAILLQFIQLIVVFSLLNEYSNIIAILGYIFYIGVFLYIINKYKSPEFKLPWVIIIMLFFVVGAFVFILFVSNDQNKKVITKFKNTKKDFKPYLIQDTTIENLKEENRDAYLQAYYILNSTQLPVYQNTLVTYYKIGEEYYDSLLKALNDAKQFILMEYFIIEEGKMWNSIHQILKDKIQQGVKVYVTYDDFGCITTLDENYYKMLNDEGIKCIPSNKFTAVMSNIHNNRDHRKITVIDGKISFTGGINIADEYINVKVKHGHWKDTGIKLEGEAVKSLTALFLETWNSQSNELIDINEFMSIEYKKKNTEGVVVPYGDGPDGFYKENVGKNVYLNMVSAAKKYLYITTPYLICDYEILNALSLSAKKGVDVRIITPHIPDKEAVYWMTKSNYELLIQNGVKIYEYTPGFIHAKNFVCDDLYAVCGTINLDYRSLVHHFECGVWMYKTKCIKDMKDDFLKTLEKSELITEKNAKLKGWKKLLAELMKVFSPLF